MPFKGKKRNGKRNGAGKKRKERKKEKSEQFSLIVDKFCGVKCNTAKFTASRVISSEIT
jgi:hypothetical protein